MKSWFLLLRYLPLLALLSGCASAPSRPTAELAALFDDSAFPAPTNPVDASTLFALSAPMRAHLDSSAFKTKLRDKGAARGLVAALYSKSDLQLDYDASITRTAAQTYAARSGNCLSLVIMTAAFARALGMEVRFASVASEETWNRSDSLYLVSSHVNIALAPRPSGPFSVSTDAEPLVIDFLASKEAARLPSTELAEEDIVALYMNNRAVEELMAGRAADAYWWARAAILKRPSSLEAYNTLAVTYARSKRPLMAERVYRAALARYPDSLVVMQNLAQELDGNGKHEEAQALLRRIERLYPAPPYHWFDRGMAAYKAGDMREAKALFAREVARAPYNDEFHFWLGVAYLGLGEVETAAKELALARDTSTRIDARERYAAKLGHLRASLAGPPQGR
ncbi:tetratricopeptide repeat protein [Massilia sp.]|uniref:tetratricopeptide repeat protein n=1 Tax=Massilia sp. TaxID=1882437 RepID=UPI0028B1B80D|nr:tetratricopeptide repeat protein [Massilia sp.]